MNIESLFRKAFGKREKLFGNAGTNCYRLFNTDGDGIPGLTIDWYGEYVLVQFFASDLMDMSDDIMRSLDRTSSMLPASLKGILLKYRKKQPDARDIAAAMRSVVVEGTVPPEGYCVLQNGVKAAVDLVGGQNTGIFLDMREVREQLLPYYRPGTSMLNLFSYTAIFSVHAVKHGITGSVNVDLSRGVLERAKFNYELNGLRVDERDFIYGDSLDWMRRFRKKSRTFSMVIFDPPTFSRNRKRTFSTKKDYRESLGIISGLAEGGYALTSINSYTISRDEYLSFHPCGWEMEFFNNEPSDFAISGNPYLKVGLWKIKNS
jgi:23S rRNA (cytosine1962-C5)-methyltransferase